MTRKAIGYCYPTSTCAKRLGVEKEGGYYISISEMDRDGIYMPARPIPGAKAYESPTDPELLSVFKSTKGKVWPLDNLTLRATGDAS